MGRGSPLRGNQPMDGLSGLAVSDLSSPVSDLSSQGEVMKRDTYKFLAGFVASLAYTHAAYAVAASKGIINEPTFLGRKWGVGFMWTEAVIYSGLGLGLAYRGWRRDAPRPDLGVTAVGEP